VVLAGRCGRLFPCLDSKSAGHPAQGWLCLLLSGLMDMAYFQEELLSQAVDALS